MRKRLKVLMFRQHESFVSRKEGNVAIKMFRGIILRGTDKRLISSEDIGMRIRIIYYRKVVISVTITENGEEQPFVGDLFLEWVEGNSSVMYFLALHSEEGFMVDLTTHFKADDSPKVSEWVKIFLHSCARVIESNHSLYEIGAVLTTTPWKELDNISETESESN